MQRWFFLMAPVLLATAGAAQLAWTNLEQRAGAALANDLSRGSLVLFGGSVGKDARNNDLLTDETWVRQAGGGWQRRCLDGGRPSPRMRHAMAYHSTGADAAARIVLFGGFTSAKLSGETWLFDGSRWARGIVAAPPARDGHAMVFDSARKVVVLFGGQGASGRLGDTWEWNGATWTNKNPATAPPARWGHAMAYDPDRKRVVLFGGNGFKNDTWEYDGARNAWTRLSPATSPPGRLQTGMAWDDFNTQVVLFGGTGPTGVLGDTWVFVPSAGTWLKKTTSNTPAARDRHVIEYDTRQRRLLLLGGEDASDAALDDVWEWSGSDWLRPAAKGPSPRSRPAMDYHAGAGHVLLFGGSDQKALGDTWTWDGAAWKQHTGVAPPARWSAAMGYDSRRKKAVLFGGGAASAHYTGLLNDTWEWDGQGWTLRFRNSVSLPSPAIGLYGSAMAYDSARGVMVLYGGTPGQFGGPYRHEVWEWDGSNTGWTKRSPATVPEGRAVHGMAYDPVRKEVVMFGGLRTNRGISNETWVWNGTDWSRKAPRNSPSSRRDPILVWDDSRAVVVLYNGFDGTQLLNDVWEWDGLDWTQRSFGRAPAPRNHTDIAYDDAHGQIVMFGGVDQGTFGDTWFLGPVHPARYTSLGSGCRGTLTAEPLVTLAPGQRPWLAGTFRVDVTSLPSTPAVLMMLGIPWPSPIKLPIGTGCDWFVNPAVFDPMPSANGVASWSAGLPNDRNLLCAAFYSQAVVLDAARFGIALTGGYEARIGAR